MHGAVLGPGSVLSSKYKLVRLLGEGGMGAVFEATHLVLGTRVAVKVLHADLARRPGLIDRFLQEAMVAARIRSENVVHVMDVERTPEGVAFMVMELLEGEPLASVLDRSRRLDEGVACEYARQILSALEAAHALGVVHRDLKPENVFVTYVGHRPVLKLIDFGIAKLRRDEVGAKNLTVAGVLMGTAEYMAPEQAYSADTVDVRADVYAVGVMLYEMLAGSRPVAGDDGRIVALKVERGEVVPLVHALPSVRPELAGLVHRAMAFRRELRFATATEMRIALENARDGRAAAVAKERVAEISKVSTGTMMGAPIEAVLAAHPKTGELAASPAARVSAGTVMGEGGAPAQSPSPAHTAHPAAPVAYAAPPAQPLAYVPSASAPSTPPRKGPPYGLLGAVLAGALVLGAGIAAAVMLTDRGTPTVSVPVAPLPTLSPTPTPTDPHPATASPPPPPLSPQVPTLVGPQPQTPPSRPSGAPSAATPDAGSAPPPMPSIVFPPMPSVMPSFPIPQGWPSVPVIPGFPVPPSPVAPGAPSAGY
jgi:serine/threonine protein kinase